MTRKSSSAAPLVASGRLSSMIVDHGKKMGWPLAELLDGVGHWTEHLQNPHAWISSQSLFRLCRNAALLGATEVALRTVARKATGNALGPYRRLLELIGDPGLAYELSPVWIALFSRNAIATVQFVERGTCILWGQVRRAHPLDRFVDSLIGGVLEAVAELDGLPAAKVELLESAAGSTHLVAYRVRYDRVEQRGELKQELARLFAEPNILSGLGAVLGDFETEFARLATPEGTQTPLISKAHASQDRLQRLELLRHHLDQAPIRSTCSARDLDIALRLCVGFSDKEIAQSLKVPVAKEKQLAGTVLKKLQVETRSELSSVLLRLLSSS